MLALALQWVLSAVSVVVVSKVLPGFRLKHFGTALIVAAIYGLLHILLYTLLKILFFLPMVLTFGLFALVINAFLLFLTDKLLDDFDIDTLWATLVGAILLTLINGLWRWLFFST